MVMEYIHYRWTKTEKVRWECKDTCMFEKETWNPALTFYSPHLPTLWPPPSSYARLLAHLSAITLQFCNTNELQFINGIKNGKLIEFSYFNSFHHRFNGGSITTYKSTCSQLSSLQKDGTIMTSVCCYYRLYVLNSIHHNSSTVWYQPKVRTSFSGTV